MLFLTLWKRRQRRLRRGRKRRRRSCWRCDVPQVLSRALFTLCWRAVCTVHPLSFGNTVVWSQRLRGKKGKKKKTPSIKSTRTRVVIFTLLNLKYSKVCPCTLLQFWPANLSASHQGWRRRPGSSFSRHSLAERSRQNDRGGIGLFFREGCM